MRFPVTLTFRMFLLALMLLALAEGRDLQRREHASLGMPDLKSLNGRDIKQLAQLAEEIKGLGVKRNSRELLKGSVSKSVRDLKQLELIARNFAASKTKNGKDLQQALSSAAQKQGEQLNNVVKKFADVSKITERGLKKELKSVKSLKPFEHPLGKLKNFQKGLFSRSSEDWQRAEKLASGIRELKPGLISKLGKNVDQRDQIPAKADSMSSVDGILFPWERDLGKILKQRDQIEGAHEQGSSGNTLSFDWFPWKRDSKRDEKHGDQTQRDVGNLSPDNILSFDWFPWKQELSTPLRDVKERKLEKKSGDSWSKYGWDWKDHLMLHSGKNENQRNQAARKVTSITPAETWRKGLLAKLNKEVKARGSSINEKKEHLSASGKRFSVEKVGDCYYVCDDVCDPVCSASCELVC